jgi:F-type H+-transporting ATPase subunit gamma
MAGGQERLLRRRIRTIQSTQKITRAQELIAASRIVRAQGRVHAAQPYSDAITQVVADLAAGGAGSELLEPRPEVRRVAHIVVTGDRGLCGAYNSNVLRAAEHAIRDDLEAGRGYSLITVGRKAEGYFRYRDYTIDAAFSGFSDAPSYEDARHIGTAASTAFLAEETDLVEIIYTRSSTWSGSPSCRSCATRSPRERATEKMVVPRRRTTSSRLPTPSSTSSSRATWSRACSPRCSTPRRRSTRPASGR